MSITKEIGYVLQSRNVSEADSIITVLGETGSKQKYIIKGIRKSKRRSILSIEIGSFIELNYYDNGKEIHNVKEINLLNRYEKSKSGYFNLIVVSYLCEITDALLVEVEKHPRAFALFKSIMNTIEASQFDILMLPIFKTKLLLELGLISEEFHCQECGEPVIGKNNSFLDPYTMEILCSDCQNIKENNIGIIRFLDQILKSKYSHLKNSIQEKFLILNTDNILNLYIRNYLNRELKTQELFYKQLRVENEPT